MKSIEHLLSKESIISSWKKNYEERKEKQLEYLDTLDYKKLELLKSKSLSDLTEDDLCFLGFERIPNNEFEFFYSYEAIVDSIKIYFNRSKGKFEMRGFLLKKEKDIFTVEELIDASLLKWKLNSIGSEPNYEERWKEYQKTFKDEAPF